MVEERKKFQFAIDRGGTFTDVFAKCPNGQVKVMKLLSVDPKNYPDAPVRFLSFFVSFILHYFHNPLSCRLKAFVEFWKMRAEAKHFAKMNPLIAATSNGLEWEPPWLQMHFWNEKEKG